ncbi:MAG: hypothetical protein GQ534_03080 [Candidatus Delongbacteria bacterium]|nr:hypothetical protein [Candidatus Delongbacteria bacterium]
MNQSMLNEIRSMIVLNYIEDIQAIYGFGSYFRSERYSDVDLVVVSSKKVKDELSLYLRLHNQLKVIVENHSVILDLTYLKYGEFNKAPILEKGQLVTIFENKF